MRYINKSIAGNGILNVGLCIGRLNLYYSAKVITLCDRTRLLYVVVVT